MAQALSRIQLRLALVSTISFALAPIIGYAVAAFFGMVELPSFLASRTGIYISICYLVLCAWVAWHFYRFTNPVIDWHAEHPYIQHSPESLQRHLSGFTTNYWSFFLIAVLVLPTIQQWSGTGANAPHTAFGLLEFMLLHLVIAIFVGMPGYLYALTLLGQLSRYIGLQAACMTPSSVCGWNIPRSRP